MTMLGNQFAGQVNQRLRMVDVRPGSKIRIHDNENAIPSFEARVIETKSEYGPNSMPALVVLDDATGQQIIVTDSGKWRIEMLVDASVLMQEAPTENLVLLQQRPVPKTGIQFLGGPGSAVEIIQWAGGRAVIAYNQGSDSAPDTLSIPTLEGVMVADVGDWIVRGITGEFYPVKPSVFEQSYDVVGGPQEAFGYERESASRPKMTSAPQPFQAAAPGLSLAAQMAAQSQPAPRLPVGVPQPQNPIQTSPSAFGGFGGSQDQFGQPMPPLGALPRDVSPDMNPLGIPQGPAHA